MLVEGRILQLGRPADLIAAPADAFVASFTGANLLHGVAGPGPNGLTRVALDGGGEAFTTEPGEGPVALAVYPWEVSVALAETGDSAVNHLRAPIASLVRLGNRVRVRVGPLTAEVTSASVDRLGLTEGQVAVASFKATGTRLLPAARCVAALDGVELEIRPEPSDEERDVIAAAIERAVPAAPRPPGYESAWRSAGLREATGLDDDDP